MQVTPHINGDDGFGAHDGAQKVVDLALRSLKNAVSKILSMKATGRSLPGLWGDANFKIKYPGARQVRMMRTGLSLPGIDHRSAGGAVRSEEDSLIARKIAYYR